ncbi:MAG TPA: hypothetical protein VKC63_01230 [Solirubrobacterales bacterium]|nr:hypothetical protein [Solirubrobacterales bacterium]
MQSNRIGAGCDASPNQTRDLHDQAIVLRHVLAVHPERLTIPDLVSELMGDLAAFAESDAYERAVRDLTGVGLLQCPCGMVEPTRAALRFYELQEG